MFTKSAFSIKIQKTTNFPSIFGSQSEKKSNKNGFKNVLFLRIAFATFFLPFWVRFGTQKFIEKWQIFENIEIRRPPLKQYRF